MNTANRRSASLPIVALIKDRKASKTPLWEICKELDRMSSSSDGLDVMVACHKARATIADTVVDRNLKGSELEKAGSVQKAIVLYERNISDRFDGTHPYERLRIIYTRLGRQEDVIRVCKAYLLTSGGDNVLRCKYEMLIAKAAA